MLRKKNRRTEKLDREVVHWGTMLFTVCSNDQALKKKKNMFACVAPCMNPDPSLCPITVPLT